MTIKELIGNLKECLSERIEIRDSNNYEICTTRSNRKGILPYLDCEIIEWFPFHTLSGGICILIKEDSNAYNYIIDEVKNSLEKSVNDTMGGVQ